MTRSPSRGGRDARSNPPRSLVALAALPFVLVGIAASKVVSASNLRRNAVADRATADGATTDTATTDAATTEGAAGTAVAAEEEPSYRVVLGDTVSEIAIRHGLPTAHVLAQNGLSWKTPIFPGQVIRLDPIPDDLEWPEAATVDERDERAS
jgi:LysM repeat protein